MKNHKKTLIGSIAAFFIGTSCCWLSTLALYTGGLAFIGVMSKFIEDFQIFLIVLGLFLMVITIYLYLKSKK